MQEKESLMKKNKKWVKSYCKSSKQKGIDEGKSKNFNRVNYPYSKRTLNVSEACKYLGVTAEQLIEMVEGKKGYPELSFIYTKKDNHITFDRSTLAEYRAQLDFMKKSMSNYRLSHNGVDRNTWAFRIG